MTRIMELVDDLKLNQEIIGRSLGYVAMCLWRLRRWQAFMEVEYGKQDVEQVEAIHMKKYIQYRQKLGIEKPITLNDNLATLVFFNYLINEEYLEEKDNPLERTTDL